MSPGMTNPHEPSGVTRSAFERAEISRILLAAPMPTALAGGVNVPAGALVLGMCST